MEDTGNTYRITLQGRPTSVVLGPGPTREPGATVEEARASALCAPKSPEVLAARLAWLEEARDAAGYVGDHSVYDEAPPEEWALIEGRS